MKSLGVWHNETGYLKCCNSPCNVDYINYAMKALRDKENKSIIKKFGASNAIKIIIPIVLQRR